MACSAPQHPRHDEQDDNRPDQGTQHAAPVEDVGVADTETYREDQVAEQGPARPSTSETSQDRGPLMFRKASPGTSMRATIPQNSPRRIAPIMTTPIDQRDINFTPRFTARRCSLSPPMAI